MTFISSEAAAAMVGATVRVATLVELQFASQTMHLWNGAGTIDVSGETWQGAGAMGSIDGLQQSRDPVSSKVTLRLSGVSAEVLAVAKANTTDVEGRPAYIWQQLFDAEWQPIGARIPVFWGTMQRISIARTEANEFDGGSRLCELEIENPFAARARPTLSRWTDADQQARHPGDRFCRFVPLQRTQTITWPDY